MKQIDKAKFQKTVEKARVKLGLAYCGKSNKMTFGVNWNDKQMTSDQLTDEQLALLWQLSNQMCTLLAREQIKRDLLPDKIKKLYANAETSKVS